MRREPLRSVYDVTPLMDYIGDAFQETRFALVEPMKVLREE